MKRNSGNNDYNRTIQIILKTRNNTFFLIALLN